MQTLSSLLVMLCAVTFGMLPVAGVVLILGIATVAGAAPYQIGTQKKSALLTRIGVLVTALLQSFIACAYAVLVVSLVRWASHSYPQLSLWPLWIAAFVHSVSPPFKAFQGGQAEKDMDTREFINLTVPWAMIAVLLCFVVTAFSPTLLEQVFGWVPFFEQNY